MTPVTLSVEVGNRGRLVLTSRDAAGRVVGRDAHADFVAAARRKIAAVALQVAPSVVLDVLERYRANGPGDYDIVGEAPAFRVRDISGRGNIAQFDTFESALTANVDLPEPVIEWHGLDHCAAVDLDFHDGAAPPVATLLSQAAKIEPCATWHWITRSGGLRLIYFRSAPMTAHDLAAVAALQLIKWNSKATVEILSRTRRPPAEPIRREQTSAVAYLSRFYEGREVAQELIDAWLDSHSMTIGGRYPHTLCPHNPSPRAQTNTEPVCVLPDGIKCFICEADGEPGFFPWARLCEGERVGGQLKACVENFANWDHARLVLKQGETSLPEPIARAAYAAMLRARHGDDPRIGQVFSVAKDQGLVRMPGYWATRTGEPLTVRGTSRIIAALPAAYVLENEELRQSPERVEWLSQSINLAAFGYPPLTTLWGCRMTRFQTLPTTRLYAEIQTARYRLPDAAPRRPRYVPSDRRMPEDAARAVIEQAYPEVDWLAVELLLTAKGCSEHRAGLAPMIFITGPTGAGKSSTVSLAAGIAGDRATNVVFTADKDRLFAGVRDAKGYGSFVNFDEFVKLAKSSRVVKACDAMEVLLSFDPEATTHKLYTGPVRLGELPVFVWTDTEIPTAISEHLQIGRRVHHVRLYGERSWEESLAAYRIEGPENLRFADLSFCEAANSILSCVIDRRFRGVDATDFAVVARELGFKQIRHTEMLEDRIAAIRRLFAAVCECKDGATEPARGDATRWQPHRGWRVIDMNSETPAKNTWAELHDEDKLEESRKISEMDLQTVLGTNQPTLFKAHRNGNRVAMRFQSVDGEVFNGDLRKTV